MGHNDREQLEAILQACIERMARGATLEQCLGAYPERAQDLRPLLLAASQLRASFAAGPSERARAAGRLRLQQAMATPGTQKGLRFPRLTGPWKAATMACTLVLVLFLGGFSVVWASSDSLPDQPLYPVKRTVERVRLSWPLQSSDSKAEFSADLAARRTDEMAAMARDNKVEHLEPLSERIQRNLDRTADIAVSKVEEALEPPAAEAAPEAPFPQDGPRWQRLEARRHRLELMRGRLQQDYQAGLERLTAVASQAPPDLQPRMQAAIQRFTQHYERALQRIDTLLDGPWPPTREGLSPRAYPGAPPVHRLPRPDGAPLGRPLIRTPPPPAES